MRKTFKMRFHFLFIIFFGFSAQSFAQDWVNLIDGKTLNGWIVRGGTAEFKLKKGVITGTTKEKIPNTFLCTEKRYADFILEYEVCLDSTINSGVQIRSNWSEGNEYVYGYQVELDPSDRAFTGGIYEEGGRGWLYPLSKNPPARKAFRNGKWNKIRVEAIGSEINTWVNGIQCARLYDRKSAEGFIGLQVHAIYSEAEIGKHIKWRKIRILENDLEANRTSVDSNIEEQSYLDNELSPLEESNGWKLLWNGKDLKGWEGVNAKSRVGERWLIRNGAMKTAMVVLFLKLWQRWIMGKLMKRRWQACMEFSRR